MSKAFDETRPLLRDDTSVSPVTPGSSAILGNTETSINLPGPRGHSADSKSYRGTEIEVSSNDNGSGHVAEHNISFSQIDRRRKILLLFLCISGMLGALSVSILTPFFPEEVFCLTISINLI